MNYKRLGKYGVNVSELCLGTMTFGSQVNEATSIELVKKAYDQGINFVDTANSYVQGKSEEIVGKAIKGMREDIVLATKVRNRIGEGPNDVGLSRKHIMKAVEDSLKRLDTDYIDIYYVHRPSNIDPLTGIFGEPVPLKETLSALTDLVRSGKVRYIGCSNFPAWLLCKALWTSDKYDLENFVVDQPPYNLLRREIEREIIPLCIDQGIGIVSWSPLAGGVLTGKYKPGNPPPAGSRGEINPKFLFKRPGFNWEDVENQKVLQGLDELSKELEISMAQLALAWLRAQPALTAPIIAASNMKQLEENLAVTTMNLKKEDLERINKIMPNVGPYIT